MNSFWFELSLVSLELSFQNADSARRCMRTPLILSAFWLFDADRHCGIGTVSMKDSFIVSNAMPL